MSMTTQRMTKFMACFLACLLGSLAACGADKAKGEVPATSEVLAVGVGVDADKALRDAFRNAVLQAVGAVVDAETVIRNEQVIKDQILTYSNGYVERFDRLKESQRDDGLYEVRIKAIVKHRQLVAKLKEAKISTGKVEGESLFGQVVTQLAAEEGAGKLLAGALEGLPVNLLTARLVEEKPKIESKNEDGVVASWIVQVAYDAKAYKEQVLPKLQNVLGDIARQKSQREALNVALDFQYRIHSPDFVKRRKYTPISRVPFWPDVGVALPDKLGLNEKTDVVVALNCGRNDKGDNRRWSWYVLDRSTCLAVLKKLLRTSPKLRVAFLDARNEVVREDELDLNKILYGPSEEDKILRRESCRPAQLEVSGFDKLSEDKVNCHNYTHDVAGFFPYFVRYARLGHPNADLARFVLESDEQSSNEHSVMQHFIIAPFFIFSPNLRVGYPNNYYGDALDIPFQTRLSLDDLKRIVAVKCSFVEGVALGI